MPDGAGADCAFEAVSSGLCRGCCTGGCFGVAGGDFGGLGPFLHWIQNLPDFPQSENFKYLLKAAGIVLVSQCLQELCRDAGQGALAYAADLAGRYLVLLTALPMMQRALDVLLELLQ